MLSIWTDVKFYHLVKSKPFPRQQILHSSKLKKFAVKNLKFNENGRKFSKRVENTVGKGEIACYKQFLFFPQSFQKTCSADQGLVLKRLNAFL